jgi:hypothetical protein
MAADIPQIFVVRAFLDVADTIFGYDGAEAALETVDDRGSDATTCVDPVTITVSTHFFMKYAAPPSRTRGLERTHARARSRRDGRPLLGRRRRARTIR